MIERFSVIAGPWPAEALPEYEHERARLTRRRVRTACLLFICIMPFYAVSDYVLYPGHRAVLLTLRVVEVLLGVAALLLVRDTAVGERAPHVLGVALGVCFALTASGIPVVLLGYATPYWVGFIIVIFGMALLLPWRPSQAASVALSLIVLYVAAALLHGEVSWPEFLCNVSLLGVSAGIALVSMSAGERLRLREFRSRREAAEAYEKKSDLAAELADKTAQLESLNREMEDLLYVASHDLRAPLINVQGFSRELQFGVEQLRSLNGKSPEAKAALAEFDESLRFILAAAGRMDALITSLLSISRIATRTNPTEQVDLDTLLRKVAESFQFQLSDKRITLQIDPLPAVCGDPVRLGQLFSNLIDNAIKYMTDGPERLIHVGVSPAGQVPEYRFFVRDTGPGIPAGQHEQIFRLFRRLGNGSCPGEGIGLTMARKIVEKHGGKMWVESTEGAGSTFWFTLPAARSLLTSEVHSDGGTEVGDDSAG